MATNNSTPTGIRSTNKLTATKVKSAQPRQKTYTLADGGGLILLIKPSGAKYWRLRYRFNKVAKMASLGVYPKVTLAAAREKRKELRELLDKGLNPNQHKQAQAQATVNTFEAITREWYSMVAPQWSEGHSKVVLKSLEEDAFPFLGDRAVEDITTMDVLNTVKRITEREAYDVARRVLRRITAALSYAAAIKGLINVNPAVGVMEYLPKPKGGTKHYPALKPSQMPEFMQALNSSSMFLQTELGLRLLMLTFVRTGELRLAKWEEFDLEGKTWVIPAERMKLPREHIVPLTDQAIEVLHRLKELSGVSEYILPSRSSPFQSISNNTLLFAIYRLGYRGQMTGHGFRSTASSYLNESGFNPDAIERQLAHGEPNKVRDAYNRSDYLGERVKLMQAWSDFLDQCADTTGKVIPIRA